MNTGRDNHLWLQLWRDSDTDFHQQAVNQLLTRFWQRPQHGRGSRVFVPLCGKSLDMIWLAALGYEVIGVELSPIAVRAFFTENRLRPVKSQLGAFTLWQAGGISILCGDYFALNKQHLGHIDTVYDRAALTALPDDLRQPYVRQLRKIVPETANIFLLTIEDPDENQSPGQASGVDGEVTVLYEKDFHIDLTHVERVPEPAAASSGLSPHYAEYKVYLLSARAGQ